MNGLTTIHPDPITARELVADPGKARNVFMPAKPERYRYQAFLEHPKPYALTDGQARQVRELRARGVPVIRLAERFGVSRDTIYAVLRGHTHAEVA